MSKFILIPKNIQKLDKKSKLTEACAYGFIRCQIKDKTYTATISAKQLADLGGWSKETSYNYLADLEANGLIAKVDKSTCQKVDHRCNVYKLEKQEKDYSIYAPFFFIDPSLTSEQKGLIMLLKTYCIPGTNHLPYSSNDIVGKMIGVDGDRLGLLVNGLIALGQAKKIGDTLVLLNRDIVHALDMRISTNWVYSVIYRFCVDQDVVPPTKNKNTVKNLGAIAAQYGTPDLLKTALSKKFKSLPKDVNISYFAQGLLGWHLDCVGQRRKRAGYDYLNPSPKHEFIL